MQGYADTKAMTGYANTENVFYCLISVSLPGGRDGTVSLETNFSFV